MGYCDTTFKSYSKKQIFDPQLHGFLTLCQYCEAQTFDLDTIDLTDNWHLFAENVEGTFKTSIRW